MRKLLSILALIICITMLSALTVFADDLSVLSQIDYSGKTLTISGNTENAGETISINILYPGKTPEDDLASATVTDGDGIILFCKDVSSNADGDFEFKIKYDDDDVDVDPYTVFIGAAESDITENDITKNFFDIYLLSETTYQNLIKDINDSAKVSYGAFLEKLDEEVERKKILFVSDYEYLLVDDKSIAYKMLFSYASETPFDENSGADSGANNSKKYDQAIIANAVLANKMPEDDKKWIDKFGLSDDLNKYYDEFDYKAVEYFYNKLDKNCESLSEFKKQIEDSIILTRIKYPNGVNNVKTIIKDYAGYLGIDTEKITSKNYQDLPDMDFADIEALKLHLGGLGEKPGDPDPGPGPGPGPGGSYTVNTSTTQTDNQPKEINMKFTDLNPCPWAYQAISTLFSHGIISGKTEHEYYPTENVTREEFAKLLVCLLKKDGSYSSNHFSDANAEDWYTKYINIAYENNICVGVGEGKFGVGTNITREDMGVMAYNALKVSGVECLTGENVFDDKNMFSDYAINPVGSLYKMKIVNGMGDNTFSPKGNATRAEAAVIIYNLWKTLNV